MRVVHTSDWHAGRRWKGLCRLPELETVLDDLALFIQREAVDLLLVSGDVFDVGAPSPGAERVVFSFLERVGHLGTQAVVLAGDHDQPHRFEAWGALGAHLGLHVIGLPRSPGGGGILELTARSGERAIVACVPFASARSLARAAGLPEEDTSYRRAYGALVEKAAAHFRPDAVNLLLAHALMEGAKSAGSERPAHLVDAWAVGKATLPANAAYVALGHLHAPQSVGDGTVPAEYAGSPLQLGFDEAGEIKSFVVIDAAPGRRATCSRIPYQGAIPLLRVRTTLGELEQTAEEVRDAGWLEVTVPLGEIVPDLTSRVRKVLPSALVIRAEPTDRGRSTPPPPSIPPSITQGQRFASYYLSRHQRAPEPDLIQAFESLYAQAEGDG